jgi:uncharacterized damage-inducible protein DinB
MDRSILLGMRFPVSRADRPLIDGARYYLGTEYRTKLHGAVEALPPEALWWRPNDSSNSVGNLIVHLVGNMRLWIVSGIGGVPPSRNRAEEFAMRDGPPASQLLQDLDRALIEVDQVLSTLSDAELVERRVIQGREVTGFDAVLHVVEHFSMHLGQIILLAKMLAPGSLRFYEDAGGLARPLWQDMARPPAL